ncbi:LysR family transcriptional regulator [Mycoavidus sp. B2-EB]|uniref:LysR family transcriptional regulator n=1 Tax=Mycoavidus sp. B2-EB TaxID=2651972 RepID=UPI0016256660|nr:LysR family transcriptional regulator [Mycoavidus sp. B2-EB]BBO59595.1 LysR family transcriptional regulator [Mycoavidus sp. B2-EB]
MIINQKRLRYFHAVHNYGQVRRAADHLHTDCSVIARQIYLLEQEIGARLFDRRPRGMVPTEVGDLLLEYYHRSQSAQQDFEVSLQELGSMRRGNINIATFSSCVDVLMDEVINDFYKDNSSCFVGIQEENSTSRVINQLLLDEVHIGIIHSNYSDHPEISKLAPSNFSPSQRPKVKYLRTEKRCLNSFTYGKI